MTAAAATLGSVALTDTAAARVRPATHHRGARHAVRSRPSAKPSAKVTGKDAGRSQAYSEPEPNGIYLQVNPAATTMIDGESTAAGFVNDIDLASFSFGSSNPVSPVAGAGAGAGKPAFSNLTVGYSFDRSVPPLQNAELIGSHLSEVLLTVVTGGHTSETVELKNVSVTSVAYTGTSGGGRPQVTASFAFQSEQLTYDYYNANGTVTTYTSGYNVATNTTG